MKVLTTSVKLHRIKSGLTTFSLLLIGLSCRKSSMNNSYSILLENHSTRPVGFYIATGGTYGTLYPDTSLPKNKSIDIISRLDVNKTFYSYSSLRWDNVFKTLPKDTLSVFIFDSDTLAKYPMEIISQQYKILKRYDLSISDLRKLNWAVPYPASSEMENMKMFPSYP
ncbi:hypothetical protein [Mucilaginibacter panaciglaebae]